MDVVYRNGLRFVGLLAAFLGIAAVLSSPAVADTITVANTDDSGAGSLRQAIADADPDDTIDFSVTGEITLASQLSIDKNLTINGPGADQLAINGNDAVRVIDHTAGNLSISGVTVTEGESFGIGGIRSLAPLTLEQVAIIDNHATDANTGGLFSSSTLVVSNSTIAANTSKLQGGGLENSSGTATITNSTISGNTATMANGGGIINQSGATLNLINSTITSNNANNGGGIRSVTGGTVNITNTILADNTAGGSGPDCSQVVTGSGGGTNLIADTSGCTLEGVTTGNVTGQDPELGALQDNGGPTPTRAIAATSPALNAGSSDLCPATDQRGVTRPQGDACDIGAVELQAPENVVLPQISGAARVGSVLSCSTGTWENDVDAYEFQWSRDGAAISPADSASYTVTSTDLGTDLTCSVTATGPVGAVTATSAALAIPVPAAPIVPPAPAASAPEITALKVVSRRRSSARRVVFMFELSQAADVELVVKRKRARKPVLERSVRKEAGKVVLPLAVKRLRPGSYRLTLIASNANGKSQPVGANFYRPRA